jgi:glutaredoxin
VNDLASPSASPPGSGLVGARVVTLYGAPDCHLCHEALAKLRRVQRLVGFELAEVDVRADPELEARFGTVIPVVAVGDRIVITSKVTEFRLLRLLPALLR